MILLQFLEKNETLILELTERKMLDLAQTRPSSIRLREGLPLFYGQLLKVLRLRHHASTAPENNPNEMAKAAGENNEPAMAQAMQKPHEEKLAEIAGNHGLELLRLGYTLSHVVHAYGALCQTITALATEKGAPITSSEFNDLNRCLDGAIAGAVTQYQSKQDQKVSNREVEHLGFLAHELRNALNSINVSFQLIKRGTVGISGSTGDVMTRSLKRMGSLIDRSLTEVRLRTDPKILAEPVNLLIMIDQLLITAEIEADERNQRFNIEVDAGLMVQVDQQLFFSALSNLIHNALKYNHAFGVITIRGYKRDERVCIEVEDQCGGLTDATIDLFKPYEQQNENRKGLGLGLAIARKAIELNAGTLSVRNLPGVGCVFTISLPQFSG